MGQKVSTVQEYTPDTKPPKKYPEKGNTLSFETPKNEKEENELNEKESDKAMQKKLGINVTVKDSKMPRQMESFIIDTIIVEKLKHLGNWNEIAAAIVKKLEDQYGGRWCAIIAKSWSAPESGYYLSPINDSYIFLAFEKSFFTICQTSDQKVLLPKNENYLSLQKKAKNENEGIEREAFKAAQKKLGINIKISKFITTDSEWPMNVKVESFVTDTIVIQRLKYSGNFDEIAKGIKEKLEDQYGGRWNVVITKHWRLTDSGSSAAQYSQIQLTYESRTYIVFKSA